MFSTTISVYAQVTEDSVNKSVPQESELNTNTSLDETTFLLNTDENTINSTSSSANQSTLWLFVRMILVLAIVIVCIYVVVRLLKKGMGSKIGDDDYLKNVSTLVLSPGKSVHVVTLGNNAYILGVTDTNINLVGKVEDEQLVNAMNLNADTQKANAGKIKDFASILSSFIPQKKDKNTKQIIDEQIIEEQTINDVEFLKKQRQRLKGNIDEE